MAQKIIEGDLLYHPVHGICRVIQIKKQKQSGKETIYYSLVPKVVSAMKARFIVTHTDMEVSGFHALVSPTEANKILDYLEAGDTSVDQAKQTWILAKNILSFSVDKLGAKDQRKRQKLEHSVKGLVGELSYVLKMTPEETATAVQKSLGGTSKINPSVLLALAEAGGN